MPLDDVDAARIWPEIRRMSENLVMINAKLDDLAPKIMDHEARIRELESSRFPWPMIGGIVGLLTIVVVIFNFATIHFGR